MGGDVDDANDLLGELCVEPKLEILTTSASIHSADSIIDELGKHADTTNIIIGIGEPGA